MPTYKAPLADIRFVLEDLLDVGQLAGLPGYADATPDVLIAVIGEAGKLCEDVLAPLNQPGDAEGGKSQACHRCGQPTPGTSSRRAGLAACPGERTSTHGRTPSETTSLAPRRQPRDSSGRLASARVGGHG